MNARCFRIRRQLDIIFLASALIGAGCATSIPNPQIVFSNASINGQPLRAILDTGAGDAGFLTNNAAQRLGVTFTPNSNDSATLAAGLSEAVTLPMDAANVTAQIMIFDHAEFGFDLLIGWPAVQNNLLVFDGTTRTVHAVSELPAEVSGWLKLKMVAKAGNPLLLEIPLANGSTGTIELDTGDPGGVTLPNAQWNQWRAVHPNTKIGTISETGGSTGIPHAVPVAQANEIVLGPLTLTNVSVRESGDTSLYRAAGDNFVASLGLESLTRIDVILDGINGVAYLHAKPPSATGGAEAKNETSDPATAAQDWRVVGPIRLKSDVFALTAAEYKVNARNYDGAIVDCNHAIDLNPGNVYAWILRATAKFDKQDFDGAIADCDHVLDLHPLNDEAALLRAVVIESKSGNGSASDEEVPASPAGSPPSILTAISIAKRLGKEMDNGDFDAAIADLNSLITLNPTDAEGLHFMRGVAWLEKGDGAHALADFDREIQSYPQDASAYIWRGVTWEIKGAFAHALADFDKGIKLQKPKEFSPRLTDQFLLSRQFLLRRLNLPTKDFVVSIAGWNDGWEKTLGRFVAGELDEAAVLAAAVATEDTQTSHREREADYYIGMMRLLKRDLNGAGVFFKKCLTGDEKPAEITSLFAHAELDRLNQSK